ncbi:tyrosine-type recombinase/integrase [Actinomadura alba]|uniref:Tyrosine-type recombinase/integrase n=2 Tax=Actinomadura alba TaxID=406431 RepID=A0ABR7LQR1_9ACTN|nr:tyrosine-type recombinase/integrase [Actinomadura alba]
MLIEQGVNIRVVQEVLGHTRVTTTQRYTHVAAAQVQDAGNRMAAACGARGGNCNGNCNRGLKTP